MYTIQHKNRSFGDIQPHQRRSKVANNTPSRSTSQKNIAPKKQVSFGGIFNYFGKSTKKLRAEATVNWFSTTAAAEAGALANTAVGDKMALSVNTALMCKRIFNIYNKKGASFAALNSCVTGFHFKTHGIATIGTVIPGAGNVANAALAYGLHQFTGRGLIKFCEQNRDFSAKDALKMYSKILIGSLGEIDNEQVRKIISKGLDKFGDLFEK